MPWSLGFKHCTTCNKPLPLSDPHKGCLKCLGESHRKDKCRISKGFRPRTQKGREILLKAPTDRGSTETSLGIIPFHLSAEHSIGAEHPASTGAVAAPFFFSVKEEAEEAVLQQRPLPRTKQEQGCRVKCGSSIGPASCVGNRMGPLQLMVPSTLEVFQAARDLMALPLLPTPKPPLALGREKAPVSKGKPRMGPLQWLHRFPEPQHASPRT